MENMNEIILKIPLDEVYKLRYALDHVQLTGEEHIDAVLSTFNDVLKESLLTHEDPTPREASISFSLPVLLSF